MQAAGYRFHLYFFWLIVEDNDLWSSLQMRYLKPTAEEPRAVTEAEVPWTVQDIVDAVNRAVTKAMRRHKERGESIVIWRDGRIVTLTADEIEIPEDERSAP